MRSRRIHIVGSGPRTGTTLLAEVMRVCFDFDKVCEHEASICESNKSFGDHSLLLTKQPSELYSIKWPLFFDPNLFIICIIRDPRDMVSSFHGAYLNTYWCSLKYWSLFKRCYSKFKNHPRILFIKYEDFTHSPNETQKQIHSKFPFLKITKLFNDYHLYAIPSGPSLNALKNLRPITPNGVGNWKNHLPRLKQQLELHGDISEDLIEFGYENNTDWITKLDSIDSKDYVTKTPEFFLPEDLKSRKTKGKIAALKIFIEKFGINADQFLSPLKKAYNSKK